jgi:hypothetical protein
MIEIEYMGGDNTGLTRSQRCFSRFCPSHIGFLWDMWDETSAGGTATSMQRVDFGELELLPMVVKIALQMLLPYPSTADLFCRCSRRCWMC